MVELIAKRYGQALFELAMESGDLRAREEEMGLVIDELEKESEFIEILSHPKLAGELKHSMIEEVFKGKISDDLLGFMYLTIEKNRQEHIVDILKYTLARILESDGFQTAYVKSAVELSDSEKQKIIDKLEQQTGNKITLESEVDPSIIGGIVIRIKDRIVDNSIKRKLHRMAVDVYEARI